MTLDVPERIARALEAIAHELRQQTQLMQGQRDGQAKIEGSLSSLFEIPTTPPVPEPVAPLPPDASVQNPDEPFDWFIDTTKKERPVMVRTHDGSRRFPRESDYKILPGMPRQ